MRAIVAAIAIVVFALFAIGLSRKQVQPPTEAGYQTLHPNMQNAKQDGDSVYFYTGSYFAKYDLKTKATQRISDFLLIAEPIDHLVWQKDSVIFRSGLPSKAYDDLSISIGNLSSPKSQNYWWRYDLINKKYELLETASTNNCLELLPYHDSLLCASADLNLQTAASVLQIFSDGQTKKLYSGSDPIRKLSVNGDAIYLISRAVSGKESIKKIVANNTSDAYQSKGIVQDYGVISNDKLLVAWSPKQPQQDSSDPEHEGTKTEYNLVLTDGKKDLSKTKIQGSRLSFSGSGDQTGIVTEKGDIYTLNKDKLKQLKQGSRTEADISGVLISGDSTYYTTVSSKLLTQSSQQVNNQRSINQFDIDGDNDPNARYAIDRPDEDGTTLVKLYDGSQTFSQQAPLIEKTLQEDMFDPSMFKFSWSLNSSSQTVPVIPNAILVK